MVTVQRRTISANDKNDVVMARNANDGIHSSSNAIVADRSNSTVDASASASLLAPASWTSVAWSLGAQVLSHGIAALANEHNLSIRRRQLLAQTTAVTAENDARFWNNMFTLGASGVQAAVQYYQGSGSGRIES